MRTLLLEFADEAAFDLVKSYCDLMGRDFASSVISTGYTSLLHQAAIDQINYLGASGSLQTDMEKFLFSDKSALSGSIYNAISSGARIPVGLAVGMKSRADAQALAAKKSAAPAAVVEATTK